MNLRSDISNYLIHFTKGQNFEEAFNNLISIISSYSLKSGNGMIKGGFNCVCFSEAPLSAIKNGLINKDYYSKYSPFGIMVSKQWLFIQGGRPVIYQKENEFNQLNSNAWRHVTYDLTKDTLIDFTWEREWRINIDELKINEKNSTNIVPTQLWADKLCNYFNWQSYYFDLQQLELIYNNYQIAELMASSRGNFFDWPIISLSD